jgi:hypothetical protein
MRLVRIPERNEKRQQLTVGDITATRRFDNASDNASADWTSGVNRFVHRHATK